MRGQVGLPWACQQVGKAMPLHRLQRVAEPGPDVPVVDDQRDSAADVQLRPDLPRNRVPRRRILADRPIAIELKPTALEQDPALPAADPLPDGQRVEEL